jgi:hypothetical protein
MRFWAQVVWFCGVVLCVLLVSAGRAGAVLGGKAGMAGVVRPLTGASAYSLLESKTSSGTIKEFADRDGIVFAVAWSGIKHPDLKSLFGEHFGDYRRALAHTEHSGFKNAWAARNDEIVVRVGGHMGGVRGFAYLPSRVPENVSIEDLQ